MSDNRIELTYQASLAIGATAAKCNGCKFFTLRKEKQCQFDSTDFTECRLVTNELLFDS